VIRPNIHVVGVEGMDEEQVQLGSSDKFWTLIENDVDKERSAVRNWKRNSLGQKAAWKKARESGKGRCDDVLRPTNLLLANKLR